MGQVIVEYAFDTAWSPPIKFLENVAKQWPNLTFVLEYEELGMGFKGLAKFQGEIQGRPLHQPVIKVSPATQININHEPDAFKACPARSFEKGITQ